MLSDFLSSIKTSSFVELGPMVNILVVRTSLCLAKRHTNVLFCFAKNKKVNNNKSGFPQSPAGSMHVEGKAKAFNGYDLDS